MKIKNKAGIELLEDFTEFIIKSGVLINKEGQTENESKEIVRFCVSNKFKEEFIELMRSIVWEYTKIDEN